MSVNKIQYINTFICLLIHSTLSHANSLHLITNTSPSRHQHTTIYPVDKNTQQQTNNKPTTNQQQTNNKPTTNHPHNFSSAAGPLLSSTNNNHTTTITANHTTHVSTSGLTLKSALSHRSPASTHGQQQLQQQQQQQQLQQDQQPQQQLQQDQQQVWISLTNRRLDRVAQTARCYHDATTGSSFCLTLLCSFP